MIESYTYQSNECLPPLPVPEGLWHDLLGIPHGEPSHQNPQDGNLVEQLAQEGQGGVEIGGGGADHDQEQPGTPSANYLCGLPILFQYIF